MEDPHVVELIIVLIASIISVVMVILGQGGRAENKQDRLLREELSKPFEERLANLEVERTQLRGKYWNLFSTGKDVDSYIEKIKVVEDKIKVLVNEQEVSV